MGKCNISCFCIFQLRVKISVIKRNQSFLYIHSHATCGVQRLGKHRRKHWDKWRNRKAKYWLLHSGRGGGGGSTLLLLLRKPRDINQNTFKYAPSWSNTQTIHHFYHRGLNCLPCIPETQQLPWQPLGNTAELEANKSSVQCIYKMLILQFWEEPVRHDLHLKTAIIMSSHRECVWVFFSNR